ncbi:MAG: prepilin-type N-terminal cleavage/methylation domain-containing protein [Gemmatimonadales bacterium]|nr:prepilin-type N-terminal cleavage/methylation domain-containing protein [Gemmatimonadales bacterium]
MARHPLVRSERGVSLMEVMFALAILSAVLIALGSLMYQVAQQTVDSAAVGYRSAAVTSAASWAERLPWDSIDSAVGCQNDSTGQLVYVRCMSVQSLASGHKSITLVVSPTGRLVVAPDTVTVERRRALSLSPFKVN